MKTVFTTGEAAKICKVSQQTIIRCFDNGQLKGFLVPGSRFRRIPRKVLYNFMKDNSIPTDALESSRQRVLLVDDDAELVETITSSIEEDGRFEIRAVKTGFEAGMLIKEYQPHLVILDILMSGINGEEICQRLRTDGALGNVRILCVGRNVKKNKVQNLRSAGSDSFVHKPFKIEQLIAKMFKLLDMEVVKGALA